MKILLNLDSSQMLESKMKKLDLTLNVGHFLDERKKEISETNHSDWKSDSLSLT